MEKGEIMRKLIIWFIVGLTLIGWYLADCIDDGIELASSYYGRKE
jgi:hypothetical protein